VVRPDLPAEIAGALERCERPSLVFDLARIDANLAAIAAAADRAGVTALFAAKSFPHPAVRALAAARRGCSRWPIQVDAPPRPPPAGRAG
jgi:diaminopimelate decarboxylase